jgi:hypothetical protein
MKAHSQALLESRFSNHPNFNLRSSREAFIQISEVSDSINQSFHQAFESFSNFHSNLNHPLYKVSNLFSFPPATAHRQFQFSLCIFPSSHMTRLLNHVLPIPADTYLNGAFIRYK